MVRKAVIPAAGLGTRFLPVTKAVPKEMLPIVDVPTIQYIVAEAVDAGIDQVILVTGRGKSAIEDHFDVSYELEDVLRKRGKKQDLLAVQEISRMANVISVRQKEPLGLGHAVLCARGPVEADEPFAVLLGDDLIDASVPVIRQLIDVYERTGKATIALMEVPDDQTHRYGIAVGTRQEDGTFTLSSVVEKPDPGTVPSRLAIIGRYVLPGKVFGYLEDTRPGHAGEIQLTDALQRLAKDDGLIGVEFEGTRYDTGDKIGWLQANLHFALKREALREPLLEVLRSTLRENS